ncbi:MAG: PilZ domain-containing protein [Proteobacteria bacterium]|nr:PilZ domain-containing protein [Pseudomonadota bacterium]
MIWSAMYERLASALSSLTSKADFAERRSHYRVPCRRSVNMINQAKAVGGHMINLSPNGMKVRSADRLPRGREMRIVVSGNKAANARFVASIDLICRVVWSKYSSVHQAYDSGLAYLPAPGVDLQYVEAFFRHELGIDDLETFQRRTSRRVSIELDVTCFTPDGRVSLGAIRDLSEQGAQFEGALNVEAGSEVRMRIDLEGREEHSLYCVGTVARCKPTRRDGWYELGVSFTEMGDPAMLKRLISREMKSRKES